MNKFKTILMMQLKEKLDLSFLKSKKSILFKVVFSLLGFVVVTAVAYVLFYLCQRLNLFSALNYIPVSFMSLLLCIILTLNLCTCTLGLSKALYYVKDNQVLVTYPVNPNTLFVSKMLVYYINEIKKAFTFVIPIFFAYGILCGLSIAYFFWMPLMLILITALPVLLGGLLSIPMNYILRFLKRYPVLKIAFLTILLGGIVAGVVVLIGLIPENINLIKSWTVVSKTIREFLSGFTKTFFPFFALTTCLCGRYENMQMNLWTEYSWIVPLVVLGCIIVLLGLNLLTSRPLYLKMITKEFEFNKVSKTKEKKNISQRPFWSTCLYEAKRNIRNTSVLSVTVATLVIAPIAVLFLNKLYGAINTRLMGDYFTIAFNVLIILLFSLAHNINVSSIFSRDGDALQINKTKPQKPYQIFVPRLGYNILSSILILVVSCSIFFSFSTLATMDCILCFFMMLFVTLTHIVWTAEIDFLKPQARVFQTEGVSGSNPNELKSIILCFAFSALACGLTIFLLMDALKLVWLKLFLVALGIFLLRAYLFHIKTKTLFKEV